MSYIFQTVGSIPSSNRIQRLKKKKQIQYGVRFLLPCDTRGHGSSLLSPALGAPQHHYFSSCITRENPVPFCWRQRDPDSSITATTVCFPKILQWTTNYAHDLIKCTLAAGQALKNARLFQFQEQPRTSRTCLCVSFCTLETRSKDRGEIICQRSWSKVRTRSFSLNQASAV